MDWNSFSCGVNLVVAMWCGCDWLKDSHWLNAVGFWLNAVSFILNLIAVLS